MRRLAASLILIALTAAPGFADAGNAPLRLRAEVVCAGPALELADLLVDPVPASLAGRSLGESPAPGTQKTVERRRVRRQLAAWGWTGGLEGPESVRVSTPGVVLDGAALAAATLVRLDALLSGRGLERRGEPDGLPERLVLSGPGLRWEVELIGAETGTRRRAALRVEDGAGFALRYSLRYDCARPVTVPVAAAPLRPGETVTAWNFARLDSFGLTGAPLSSPELAEAVAKRTIAAGEPLTRRNVKPSLLVRAGREVEIAISRGAVSVSLKGIARRDGGLGDLVTVRRLDNRELARYRVVGRDRVAPSHVAHRENES